MPSLPPTSDSRTAGGSVAPAYFDALFAAHEDPWAFASSPYEAGKYRDTLDALPRARYARALEVGCAIGVFTRQLAERCDHVLAVDVAEAALEAARSRCSACAGVVFEQRTLPAEMPPGPFDLALLSEVGYYWAPHDLERAVDALFDALAPGGHLALVHWTGPTDYPLTGDVVHETVLSDGRWRARVGHRRPSYRLDIVERQA